MSILPPSAYGLNLSRSDPTMSSSHGSLVFLNIMCVRKNKAGCAVHHLFF
jgi:hypothetical protein